MAVDRLALGAFGLLTATSSVVAAARRGSARSARRSGTAGNSLFPTHDGVVEYRYLRARGTATATVVCENGLCAPLEGWDWLATELAGTCNVLVYHRAGYGATRTRHEPGEIIEAILREREASDPRIVYVGHSLGGLIAVDAVTRFPWLRNRVRQLVLIDSTDAAELAVMFDSPERRGKVEQSFLLEYLGGILGTLAIANPFLREVDYRAGVQRAFGDFSIDTRNIRNAQRELRRYAASADAATHPLPCRVQVVAAEYGPDGPDAHRRSQESLAGRLGAPMSVVLGSAHRSIIGRQEHASQVAALIRDGARQS
ncbi:alpha/beta fold hydrolase [Nocardia sp. KC 131]|uniref:alpha/beta fold hydrolase n=1 Tax=Nocardia arseniciresistens TaxID=3392119 RepID=UPI00398EC5E8